MTRLPFFKATEAQFYAFGDAAKSLFKSPLNWSFATSPQERWAILGPNASLFLSATLLGRSRVSPSANVTWPLLESQNASLNLDQHIKRVSFSTRLRGNGPTSASGEFTDFTARYGALQEDDRVTLRDHLTEYLLEKGLSQKSQENIEKCAKMLNLEKLLDMPLVTLSNGQTRRARIARGILSKSDLLILEEPFTGLDVTSRENIQKHLLGLHKAQSPALIFTLRKQDGVPSFITHAVELSESANGERDIVSAGRIASENFQPTAIVKSPSKQSINDKAEKLVEMKAVNVNGRTPVLRDINWTIRQSEKWRLKGANGSGKSTLLALITGDHPQSFTQSHLKLFGKDRGAFATALLQNNIGHFSPEIMNAFPRKHGPGSMKTFHAISSGFENIFVTRKLTDASKIDRVHSLARDFGFMPIELDTVFAALSPPKQVLALFLRAIVSRPKLLILDEPFSGMTAGMTTRAQNYLNSELDPSQAVILISHFDDEIPTSFDRVFELDQGHCILNE